MYQIYLSDWEVKVLQRMIHAEGRFREDCCFTEDEELLELDRYKALYTKIIHILKETNNETLHGI